MGYAPAARRPARVGNLSALSCCGPAHLPAADLSHIPTKAKVTGHKGADQLAEAVKDASIVVIPAGVPRKPGMTRDDLFNTNASIVATLTDACAKCVLLHAVAVRCAGCALCPRAVSEPGSAI